MKKILLLVFYVVCFYGFSQESAPIVTDRPTQSAAASTVGKNNLLIETGFIFENTDRYQNYINANSLFRYGVGSKVEIRLTANYDRIGGDDYTVSTIGSTNIGTKVFIVDSDKAFADISVIGQLNLPTGKENDQASGEIRFNFANQLSEKFSLGYNIGVLASPDRESELSPFYTLVLGASIANGLSVFAEPYGYLSEIQDHRFNTGIIYLAKENMQFDLTGGIGLTRISPDYFIGFGAAIGF